jgi:hypothetical protein
MGRPASRAWQVPNLNSEQCINNLVSELKSIADRKRKQQLQSAEKTSPFPRRKIRKQELS